MFELGFLLARLALIGGAIYLSVLVAVLVGVAGFFVGIGVSGWEFVTLGSRAYRGRSTLQPLRILPPPQDSSAEPAYRSYYFGPAAREFALIAADTARGTVARIRGWLTLLKMRVWERNGALTWRLCVGLPIIGAGIGLVVGAVTGGVLVGLVAVFDASVIAVVIGIGLLFGGVMRVFEITLLWLRGITVECPSCHHRVTRPIYRCSGAKGCGAPHKSLVPGTLGIFRRVCRCQRSLPTLLLLGKINLASQCQHCGHLLPDKSLSERTFHIPVAGGPQVGKSVFMGAAVQRLSEMARDRDASAGIWADERTQREFESMKPSLRNPEQMRKTIVARPKAYNLYLGLGGKRRLVYLYDPAGEYFEDSTDLAQADFNTYTKGIVFCVDPFSLAGLRRRVERAVLDQARSSPSDPKAAIERATENLRETFHLSGSRKLAVRAAVVVTKADALRNTEIDHPYSRLISNGTPSTSRAERDAAMRGWIAKEGVRADIITTVVNNYESCSFFVVSHEDASLARRKANKSQNDDPADPVNWLLNETTIG